MPNKSSLSLSRDLQPWGIRLVVKPFPDSQYIGMEISAEIAHPKPGRNAEITFRFSGVPANIPMRATDLIVWMAAMTAVNDEARKVGEDMKAKAAKKK